MSLSRLIPFFIFAAASDIHGQAVPPSLADKEEVVTLNQIVVSAGIDDKTAFDLAQGTSILAGAELQRRVAGTLGETLAATPGVSSTSYGPGASRPIIRGLGGDRIRVLDNGIGSLDASNVSPDHNTALEPLFASRIEVLRGPSTLLYGSSAVGGVVNVIDNAIPSRPPGKSPTAILEMRGGGAANERTGVVSLGTGTKNLGLQFNGLRQYSGDARIPSVARIDADAPTVQPAGRLPNSDVSTKSGSIGATWFGTESHLGAAVSTYATTYGVPTDEPIGIAMRQRRLDLEAESGALSGIFTGLRVRLGAGDYTHSELADRTTVSTTFNNRAWEGRLELPYALADDLSGTFGVQAARSDFSAIGDEVVTPPSVTSSQALFALQEWKFSRVTLQAGGRLERQAVTLGTVNPALPAVRSYRADTGERRTDDGFSGSLGGVFYPAKDWAISLSLAHTERLPTTQERFSNGPHGGTGAYEVGTAGLGLERSLGVDLSVRRRAGFVTGAVSVFVNRFRGYIFEAELPAGAIPAANNPEDLTPYQFVARDAEFLGGEAELTLHLLENNGRSVHLVIDGDYVRAEQTTDRVPLPRIPPLRFGVALRYEGARWHVGLETRLVSRQDRVAPGETSTLGYTLLSADAAYSFPVGAAVGEFFVRGTNLTDHDARVHTSFLKEFSPVPGQGIVIGMRVTF